MSRSREHFHSFGDHTLLKHAILRSYLLQLGEYPAQREGRQS
jgi:hypothetical protein